MQANVHVGWLSKSSVISISSSYVGVCLGHARGTVFPTGLKWTYTGVGGTHTHTHTHTRTHTHAHMHTHVHTHTCTHTHTVHEFLANNSFEEDVEGSGTLKQSVSIVGGFTVTVSG